MNERACVPGCSGTCTDGRCVKTLASNQKYPDSIAVGGGSVYWTTDPDEYGAVGTVMAAPLNGGPSRTLASGQQHPCDLAVDSTNVYWTNGSSFWPGIESRRDDGSVMKAPLAGGVPTVLASGQTGACGISVVGAEVYWVTQGALMKIAVNGGDATRVLSAYDGSDIVAIGPEGAWLLGQHGALLRDQSMTSARATRLSSRVALGPSDIYWLDGGAWNARVMRAPLRGSQPATLSVLGEKLPHVGRRLVSGSKIAVDSTNVYVISEEERYRNISGNVAFEYGFSVATVPTTGGCPVMLAWHFGEYGNEHTPGGIAVDATSVYYADAGAGTVLKMTPK
jgi:hypothetical protein